MRKIKTLLLGVLFTFSILLNSIVTVEAASPKTYIEKYNISGSGLVEVYGYIKDATVGNQITILLTLGNKSQAANITSQNANQRIAYIDQITCGNNHSFLFKFNIRPEFLGKELTVSIGNDSDAPVVRKVGKSPSSSTKFTLTSINDNDIIYGRDVYDLNSAQLTPRNVADSIIFGGNKIYYKIGDHWYDLLDKNATDSSFLVESNALTQSEINNAFNGTTPLRYYYCQNDVRLDYDKY